MLDIFKAGVYVYDNINVRTSSLNCNGFQFIYFCISFVNQWYGVMWYAICETKWS